ncbi:MAG: hypothetical protein L0Y71_18390 [Gemmataceae bacterium]|nr:hypothetical protein [Gemmataceae bacterium]
MSFVHQLSASLVVAAWLLSLPVSAPAQGMKKMPTFPKEWTWNLKALEQAPLKVVSTHYDAKAQTVFWVLELVRDLDVFEDHAYWGPAYKEGRRTRFRFELHDADGIVLKTVEGRYVGEYVAKAGKRFGAVLELPFELVKYIRTIEAIGK